MKEKKSAEAFCADLLGLRSEKYGPLLENDIETAQWQDTSMGKAFKGDRHGVP